MTTPPDTEEKPERISLLSMRTVFVLIGSVALLVAVAWGLDRLITDDDAGGDDAVSLSPLLQVAEESVNELDGSPAPDFSIRTFDGGDFTLSRHLADDGRPIVLNLWASWCFPCREEMPHLDDFAAANPEVAVVGVAVRDDPVAAQRFVEELGVGYILGIDEKEEVDGAYRAVGLPATFWIDSDGTIVKREFGAVTVESLEADLAVFD